MSEHGCLRGVKEGAGGVYGDLFLKFLCFFMVIPNILPIFAAFRVGFGGILADDILS